MDTTSPARLYATVVGAVLVFAGITGFFYEASFSTGADLEADKVFGILAINGWHNAFHIVAGLIGLAAAGSDASARLYCFAFGAAYLVLAVWGFAESDEVLIELLPVNDEDNVLHLLLGVLGLAAGAATPAEEPPTTAAA